MPVLWPCQSFNTDRRFSQKPHMRTATRTTTNNKNRKLFLWKSVYGVISVVWSILSSFLCVIFVKFRTFFLLVPLVPDSCVDGITSVPIPFGLSMFISCVTCKFIQSNLPNWTRKTTHTAAAAAEQHLILLLEFCHARSKRMIFTGRIYSDIGV